jgi:hypothetical protein
VDLRLPAAARHVGLSESSFRRAVAAGLISFRLHPYGGRRFAVAALDAYLEQVSTRSAVPGGDSGRAVRSSYDALVQRARPRLP